MSTPRKHRDVIIAWAMGDDIQREDQDGWFDWNFDLGFMPNFDLGNWRIKPKIVKRDGWVNVYKYGGGYSVAGVHGTEEDAVKSSGDSHIARVRIEWEEEV